MYIDYSLAYIRELRLDWNKLWIYDELYALEKFPDNIEKKVMFENYLEWWLEWNKENMWSENFK